MANEGHVEALRRVARRAMIEKGLLPDFSPSALRQLEEIPGPARAPVADLREMPWCSIDNDDSKDLDQLSVCEELPGGVIRLLVAVADVDALVDAGTPLDEHAAHNTTTVYTAAEIFPMLPERLSTDLTSLNPDVDRVALVIDYRVDDGGAVIEGTVYRALVHSQAQLAYDATAAWLEGQAEIPPAAARVSGLDRNLRAQDEAAQRLRKRRMEQGALELASIEAKPVFEGDRVVGLIAQEENRARQLIAELMVASNGVSAEFLADKRFPGLRRVVRAPERWLKIVDLAAEYGVKLPAVPSSKALEGFLATRRAADPLRFPDLSLTVVKLMGRGEYVAEKPGEDAVGHFGLAVKDYSHTTAPNRRYPDLVTHRQLKAALAGNAPAYDAPALTAVAARCSEMETAATKVERQVRKSAAVLVLEGRSGETFDGIVTGASDKGTYVRVLDPPAEGKVVKGEGGLRVGDKVRVKLLATDFDRGFIDFARAR
jgi:VacB/RNase II family 3'-5' exoribonuclease